MVNTIYQIYYNDSQKRYLMPGTNHYDNSEGISPFFENDIILRLVANGKHLNCDKFGVISWMFERKIASQKGWNNGYLNELLDAHNQYDIVSVFGSHKPHNTLLHGGHGNTLPRLIQYVLNKLGYNIDVDLFVPEMIVYMNFFFAKPHIYELYVREMLLPAIELMCDNKDKFMQDMVWSDSRYKRLLMTKNERERFIGMFGVNYYPNHTFVCERLFSVWLTANKKKYTFKQMI